EYAASGGGGSTDERHCPKIGDQVSQDRTFVTGPSPCNGQDRLGREGEARMTVVLDTTMSRSDTPMTVAGGGRNRRGEPADERIATLAQFSSAYRQLVAATTPTAVARAAVEAARGALGGA